MAGVVLTPPLYSGDIDEDFNIFAERFIGIIHGMGLTIAANGDQIKGIYEGCLTGYARDWYNEKLLGKRWELTNVLNNHGVATVTLVRAQTHAQLIATNSLRGSALVYAQGAGVNGIALNADASERVIWPLPNFMTDWSLAGGEPSTNPINVPSNVAGGVAGNPIVFPTILIGEVIGYMAEQFPTILEEKRKLRFGTLEQSDGSVRKFYNDVVKYGKMLRFSKNVMTDQFLRGLSYDNQLEVERIGAEKSIDELVKILEKIEERKAEMKLGRNRRNYDGAPSRQQPLQPVRLPAITETIFPPQPDNRPLDHLGRPRGAIDEERINQLLKTQAEIFQKQLQALQDKIDSQKMAESNAPQLSNVERMQNRTEEAIADYNRRLDEGPWSRPPNENILRIADRISKQIEKTKVQQADIDIFEAIHNLSKLSLNGTDDTMDTNVAHGEKIVFDEEGNIYTFRGIKKK